MKKTYIVLTILLISFFFLSLFPGKIWAAESCPESMPIQERYTCLQNELNKLESSQGSLQKKLKNEDYQQLSLNEKIKYLTTQIIQNEKVIETLQIEVLAQDIEISILSKDITKMEDDVNILNQEIKTLERTVNERVRESYKYSYVGALEFLFDVKDLDSILRKTKYLIETRLRDKNSLEEYSEKMVELEDEELILENQKAELQKKRNDLETEKLRLEEEKKNLDAQKIEKASLLAESERREASYKKELAETTAMISSIDEKISDIVIALFNSGGLGNGSPVNAGNVIGFQGHTGCSFGSHLHFEIRDRNNVKQDPSKFLNGGAYWSSVTSKIYQTPLSGARITQTYKTTHRAWDMVSMTSGIQDGSTYTVPTGICSAVDSYIASQGRNWAYLTGEGAPIKAVASGIVYYGLYQTNLPAYPSKYALVVHSDGNKSFYLHLK